MTAMFRSFASFNYRTWFAGAVISNIGGWMQATAQDWVVLTELTDNDATAMGVTMALQFGPPLLLVSLTGWVADRFDRRKVLLTTQTTLMLLALGVAALLLTGVMTLPLMFCFAAAFGVTKPVRVETVVTVTVGAGPTSSQIRSMVQLVPHSAPSTKALPGP